MHSRSRGSPDPDSGASHPFLFLPPRHPSLPRPSARLCLNARSRRRPPRSHCQVIKPVIATNNLHARSSLARSLARANYRPLCSRFAKEIRCRDGNRCRADDLYKAKSVASASDLRWHVLTVRVLLRVSVAPETNDARSARSARCCRHEISLASSLSLSLREKFARRFHNWRRSYAARESKNFGLRVRRFLFLFIRVLFFFFLRVACVIHRE